MTTSPSSQIIAGRYQVRASLGGGAFGEVYEVYDLHLQQVSALKLLKKTPLGVWAEAQVLRQVHGEFILPILNADLAAGAPYVVTEVATHGTLADRVIRHVGVPVSGAVRWTRQACQGLSRIHDHNLLHGDIKPENLFLNEHDDVLVGDLGLAQLMDAAGATDARGSVTTMAPEVARVGVPGLPVSTTRVYTARSDVYSLGATLYWLLSGSQPVPNATTYADVWHGVTPDLWDIAPHVSQGVRDIVMKAISRDPSDRYGSPAELDAALGGRRLPAREWERTPPHAGHDQCYAGTKAGSRVEVCAAPTGKSTQVEITARHESGRSIHRATRTTPRSRLAVALRATFRMIG